MTLAFRVIFFCFVLCSLSFAQGSREELEEKALEFFENENFIQAKPLYAQLLSLDPVNPTYNYKYGACVLWADKNHGEAIVFLKAGNKDGVDKEIEFFLGNWYHLNYQFSKAQKHYKTYIANGKGRWVNDAQNYLKQAQNGQQILKKKADIIVQDKKRAKRSNFFRFYDQEKLAGRVIVYDEFRSKLDEKRNHHPVVYFPPNAEYIYFSSYGKKGDNGLDIYRTKKVDGKWMEPERLSSVINTPYDEDFPTLSLDGKKLYFSSKGHNSIGAYDIFESVADEDMRFSSVENLNYAINSPDDDYLYIPTIDSLGAMFSSSRFGNETYLDIYTVELSRIPSNYIPIKGIFTNDLKANLDVKFSVVEAISNRSVGEFKTNPSNGAYTLSLPGPGIYSFLVVYAQENVKKTFEVTVPEGQKSFKQILAYKDPGGNSGLTLENKWEGSWSEEDFAQMLFEQSKLNVNANQIQKGNQDFAEHLNEETENPTEVKTQEIEDDASKEVLALENELENLTKNKDQSKVLAYQYLMEAFNKSKEAKQLLSSLNGSEGEERDALLIELKTLNNEVEGLQEKAKALYQISETMENSIESKKGEIALAKEYEELLQEVKSLPYDQAQAKVRAFEAKMKQYQEDNMANAQEEDKIRKRISELRDQSTQLVEELGYLNEEMSETEQMLDSLKKIKPTQSGEELEYVNDQIYMMNETIKLIRGDRNKSKDQIDNNKRAVAALESQLEYVGIMSSTDLSSEIKSSTNFNEIWLVEKMKSNELDLAINNVNKRLSMSDRNGVLRNAENQALESEGNIAQLEEALDAAGSNEERQAISNQILNEQITQIQGNQKVNPRANKELVPELLNNAVYNSLGGPIEQNPYAKKDLELRFGKELKKSNVKEFAAAIDNAIAVGDLDESERTFLVQVKSKLNKLATLNDDQLTYASSQKKMLLDSLLYKKYGQIKDYSQVRYNYNLLKELEPDIEAKLIAVEEANPKDKKVLAEELNNDLQSLLRGFEQVAELDEDIAALVPEVKALMEADLEVVNSTEVYADEGSDEEEDYSSASSNNKSANNGAQSNKSNSNITAKTYDKVDDATMALAWKKIDAQLQLNKVSQESRESIAALKKDWEENKEALSVAKGKTLKKLQEEKINLDNAVLVEALKSRADYKDINTGGQKLKKKDQTYFDEEIKGIEDLRKKIERGMAEAAMTSNPPEKQEILLNAFNQDNLLEKKEADLLQWLGDRDSDEPVASNNGPKPVTPQEEAQIPVLLQEAEALKEEAYQTKLKVNETQDPKERERLLEEAAGIEDQAKAKMNQAQGIIERLSIPQNQEPEVQNNQVADNNSNSGNRTNRPNNTNNSNSRPKSNQNENRGNGGSTVKAMPVGKLIESRDQNLRLEEQVKADERITTLNYEIDSIQAKNVQLEEKLANTKKKKSRASLESKIEKNNAKIIALQETQEIETQSREALSSDPFILGGALAKDKAFYERLLALQLKYRFLKDQIANGKGKEKKAAEKEIVAVKAALKSWEERQDIDQEKFDLNKEMYDQVLKADFEGQDYPEIDNWQDVQKSKEYVDYHNKNNQIVVIYKESESTLNEVDAAEDDIQRQKILIASLEEKARNEKSKTKKQELLAKAEERRVELISMESSLDSLLNRLKALYADAKKLKMQNNLSQYDEPTRNAILYTAQKSNFNNSLTYDDNGPSLIAEGPEPMSNSVDDGMTEGFQIGAKKESVSVKVYNNMPSGAYYKVQIGAFSKPIPQDLFSEFNPLSGQKLNNGITRYFAGHFYDFNEAKKAQDAIRKLGYKDAFVVAFNNGDRIALDKGKELIKKSGGSTAVSSGGLTPRPAPEREVVDLNSVENIMESNEVIITVQVGAFKDMPDRNLLSNMEPLSYYQSGSYYKFCSGKFKDMASARAHLTVVKQSAPDAFLVAFKNGQKVSIQEALNSL